MNVVTPSDQRAADVDVASPTRLDPRVRTVRRIHFANDLQLSVSSIDARDQIPRSGRALDFVPRTKRTDWRLRVTQLGSRGT